MKTIEIHVHGGLTPKQIERSILTNPTIRGLMDLQEYIHSQSVRASISRHERMPMRFHRTYGWSPYGTRYG